MASSALKAKSFDVASLVLSVALHARHRGSRGFLTVAERAFHAAKKSLLEWRGFLQEYTPETIAYNFEAAGHAPLFDVRLQVVVGSHEEPRVRIVPGLTEIETALMRVLDDVVSAAKVRRPSRNNFYAIQVVAMDTKEMMPMLREYLPRVPGILPLSELPIAFFARRQILTMTTWFVRSSDPPP